MKWLRNITTSYLRFISGLVIMALLTPFVIDHIGPDGYGMWVIVYAVIGIISLSDLGFATAAIKFLAEADSRSDRERDQVAGSLCIVYSALTLFCLAVVLAVYHFKLTPVPDIFLMLGMATVISMSCCVHRAALIAAGRQDIVNWVNVVGSIMQATLTVALLSNNLGIYGIALSHSIFLAAQSVICVPLAIRHVGFSPVFHNPVRHIMVIARFSVWALIANTSFLIILRIDPIIIEKLMTLEAVAVFAIALKIAEQALLFNKQFSNALMPLVSRLQGSGDRARRAQLLVLSTRYLLAFSVPMLLLLAVNAEDLINLWVGPAFSEAAVLLEVLCLAVLFSTIQFNAANVNGMSGYPQLVAGSLFLAATVKLILTLALLSWLGLIGAALATLTAFACCEASANVYQACRITLLPIRTFFNRSLLPGFVCSIPPVVLALATETHETFFSLLLVNACYGAFALFLFYGFFVSQEEKKTLKVILTKKEPLPCLLSTGS